MDRKIRITSLLTNCIFEWAGGSRQRNGPLMVWEILPKLEAVKSAYAGTGLPGDLYIGTAYLIPGQIPSSLVAGRPHNKGTLSLWLEQIENLTEANMSLIREDRYEVFVKSIMDLREYMASTSREVPSAEHPAVCNIL